jgi:hypothetical protein
LLRALNIGDDSLLRIRSLSFDIPRLEQSLICTAIVSFGKPIERLHNKNFVLNAGGTILCVDTVFGGFTPLSPRETSPQQKIEYVSRMLYKLPLFGSVLTGSKLHRHSWMGRPSARIFHGRKLTVHLADR